MNFSIRAIRRSDIMEANKETLIYLGLIAIFFFFLITLIPGGKKTAPDPDEDKQREFAKDMLRGNVTPEEIAEKEGYDLEHVKKWKDDYTKLCIKYALDSEKYAAQVRLLEEDIAWFTSICRKYIGDDWEAKTGFADHNVTKYKGQ